MYVEFISISHFTCCVYFKKTLQIVYKSFTILSECKHLIACILLYKCIIILLFCMVPKHLYPRVLCKKGRKKERKKERKERKKERKKERIERKKEKKERKKERERKERKRKRFIQLTTLLLNIKYRPVLIIIIFRRFYMYVSYRGKNHT